ncbi:MAG: hypothetical protein CVU54_06930 [Deltaproteobacteria bacterium HGW-Deltaproteobacteria-12]|jgi:predicted RNA-binding protein|nr:MAG: hypothetical protein CVU54_06930 [Deltaproteobacteria bacterium HGW-Deltaproteobacteria-12]
MCLATAYRKRKSPGHKICENVCAVKVDGDKITLDSITADSVTIEGKVSSIDLDARIILID